MVNFLIQYGAVIISIFCVLIIIGLDIYNILSNKKILKTELQKANEWLLYAVTAAEKELGSGTGQIKLRYVYDKFLKQFPKLAKMISFSHFSSMVDNALEKFKNIIESNTDLQKYIDEKVS